MTEEEYSEFHAMACDSITDDQIAEGAAMDGILIKEDQVAMFSDIAGSDDLLGLDAFICEHPEHAERLTPVRDTMQECLIKTHLHGITNSEVRLMGPDIVGRSPSDPEQAAEVLRLMEGYLREEKPVPFFLAEHLADAIMLSMSEPVNKRAKAFTDALGLTANNKRPKANYMEVGLFMSNLLRNGSTQKAAELDTMERFKIGRSTVLGYIKACEEELGKKELSCLEAAKQFGWD